MTDAQEQRATIEDLVARTGTVAEAANRAVEGLDAGDDELVNAVIAQLHSVNDECERIHGVLDRVSAMIPEEESEPDEEPDADEAELPPPAPADASETPEDDSSPPPSDVPLPPLDLSELPPPGAAGESLPPPSPEDESPADPYGPPPGSPGQSPVAVPSAKFVPHEAPPPIAYEGRGLGNPGAPPSEGIRLLATQMAVAGETVADIERRLRTDFGVSNAGQVVRELFGPSGDPV